MTWDTQLPASLAASSTAMATLYVGIATRYVGIATRQHARCPQLYSRIGFAHQYKPLDPEDIPAVLAHYWQQLGLPETNVDPDSELIGIQGDATPYPWSGYQGVTG